MQCLTIVVGIGSKVDDFVLDFLRTSSTSVLLRDVKQLSSVEHIVVGMCKAAVKLELILSCSFRILLSKKREKLLASSCLEVE